MVTTAHAESALICHFKSTELCDSDMKDLGGGFSDLSVREGRRGRGGSGVAFPLASGGGKDPLQCESVKQSVSLPIHGCFELFLDVDGHEMLLAPYELELVLWH